MSAFGSAERVAQLKGSLGCLHNKHLFWYLDKQKKNLPRFQPPERHQISPNVRDRSEASAETPRKQRRPPRPFLPHNLLFTMDRFVP